MDKLLCDEMQIIFSDFCIRAKNRSISKRLIANRVYMSKDAKHAVKLIKEESFFISNFKSIRRARIAILLDKIAKMVDQNITFSDLSRCSGNKGFDKVFEFVERELSYIKDPEEDIKSVYAYATFLLLKEVVSFLSLTRTHYSNIDFHYEPILVGCVG